jgi:ribosomal protein L19
MESKNINPFKNGRFYRINYILCKKDEVRKCYFEGLCINNYKNSCILNNKIKKEKITFNFTYTNPLIIEIKKLRTVRKNKLKKIYWVSRGK